MTQTPQSRFFKLASLMLAAGLLFSVYSCNNDTAPTENKTEEAAPAKDTMAPAPAAVDTAAKAASDTGGKGGQTPPPPAK